MHLLGGGAPLLLRRPELLDHFKILQSMTNYNLTPLTMRFTSITATEAMKIAAKYGGLVFQLAWQNIPVGF